MRKSRNLILIICASLVVSAGCDHKENVVKQEDLLAINSVGIENDESKTFDLLANKPNSKKTPEGQIGEIISTPYFDVMTSITSNTPSEKYAKKAEETAVTTFTNLNETYMYRLLIYDSEDLSTPLYNAILKPNEQPKAMLVSGKTYKWYTYTVSSGTFLPAFDNGKILRDDLIGRDLAVDYGTINLLPDRVNYLNIRFKKTLTRFQINLNIRGLMGEFNGNNNTTTRVGVGSYVQNEFVDNIIQLGDYMLVDNNPRFGSLTPVLNYTLVINTNGSSDQAKESSKWQYIYTASFNSIPANQLALKITNLLVKHDDNGQIRDFTPSSSPSRPQIIVPLGNTNSLPLGRAITYKMTVRLIESALTIGNIKWARTNLFLLDYNNDKPTKDRYIFRYDNNYTNARETEYWSTETEDPCSKVYPNSVWRLPNTTEIQTLINTPNISRDQIAGSNSSKSTQYNVSNPSQIGYNEVNKLILPYLGYKKADNTIDYSTTQGQYWSVTTSAGLNYRYLKLNSTGETFETTVGANEKRTIRCVRAN